MALGSESLYCSQKRQHFSFLHYGIEDYKVFDPD